jgi:hypothetical protein
LVAELLTKFQPGGPVTIGKITLPGLAGMAVAVALLWGCLISERLIVRQAANEQARALREIQRLRQRLQSQPASTPIPPFRRPPRLAVG